MVTLKSLTAQLRAGAELTADGIESAAEALESSEVPDDAKAEFLESLAHKGETAGEIAAFATAFRRRARNPQVEAWASQAIDVVGTGGDHSGGFNISSLVTLTLASVGVPVMKHGNRGITSKCGSADLLAGLGVDLEAPPEKLPKALAELGYVFFFAPAYHPAFKHIAPVRKALAARGQRTVFNILGPLINPGRPDHVLLGSFSEIWVSRLAQALQALGVKSGLVVHGVIAPGKGIDELTTATANRVLGLGRAAGIDAVWRAEDHGLMASSFEDLKGGDLDFNLALVEAVLAGRGPRALVDTVTLNTAVGLWLTGKTASIREGLAIAREALLGGAVRKKIAATREFYRA